MSGRVEDARALLRRHGLSAPVAVAGTDGEIVTVTGPPGLREPLAALAPALRSLGFRYVALEIDSGHTTERRDT